MTKRSVPLGIRSLITAAATVSLLGAAGFTAVSQASPATSHPATSHPPAGIVGQVYVSPGGSDGNPGTAAAPVQTISKAQALVRTLNQNMNADLTVVLEDGFYRMTSPLTLTAADSGTNGHTVHWTAATGAHPVLAGSAQITGWQPMSAGSPIWVAQAPAGLQTRQLYVDGARASRANGTLPAALTGQDSTGYSGGGSTMAAWRNPSGAKPQLEFVYRGGLGAWTEPRCPVASFSGAAVVMAQPCWTNSTARAGSFPDGRAYNLVGRSSITEQPTSVENAFQFLGAKTPGQWFLDQGDSKLYYVPRPGETMSTADVEAPVLQQLVTGGGTASAPLRDVAFSGIQFSYATWLGPQFHTQGTSDGFSEIQANYQVTGANGAAAQGLCHIPPPSYTKGTCPFGAWTQIPGNVSLTYDQGVQFTNDAFVHLGAAGLALGDGSQNDVVKGEVVTDVSGNGIELGNVDQPTATGASQTSGNAVTDNHVFDVPAEFHGGVGIDSGYTAHDTVSHNQIDHTPYTAISQGWGGWPDKEKEAPQANFSRDNAISDNLIFDHMGMLNDGGAIYTQGITGTSLADGEHVTGNDIHDQTGSGHVIYTDNGCTFETITGNAVYNNPSAQAWSSRHTDYAPGHTTTYDPTDVEGNYFENPAGYTTGGGVTVKNNTTITSPSQIPTSITANAGIESAYQSILSWTQAPLPPVPDPHAAVAVSITVNHGVAGTVGTVGTGFAGFSYEKDRIGAGLFDAHDTALVNLFRLLGPSYLRIGGNEVDRVNWNPAGTGGSATEIAPADVDKLAAFAKATGWKVIYGINLKTNTPANAVSEAQYAAHALGKNLAAFEIGNEPNVYDSEAAYEASFNTYTAAIRAKVPTAAFDGPGTYRHGAWDAQFAADEKKNGLTTLSMHMYIGKNTTATIPGMLASNPTSFATDEAAISAAKSTNDIPQWRMTEANSYFDGGAPGVSDVEAASLWSLDFMEGLAAQGASGVNFHGGTSGQFPINYSPIVFNGLTPTGVQGVYYGELLWKLAGTGPLHTASVTGGAAVSAWSIGDNVFIDNKGSAPITTTITLPAPAATAHAYTLTAPSLTSKAITIAGSTVSGTGAFRPTPTPVPVTGARAKVSVPAGSAVLVVAG
ncbi:glycosyl hydrolase family protein [Catenulispora pinisilvae]|uniref:glycosyl hydrolase family protein n=1 Tax=Catenulispora pinisilvae TaxID=2705253 RepID=UPI001891E0E1|nr:glycosyl hydrolase family protein [Catenulispora pinisilvae]